MKEVTFLERLAENLLEGSFNRILKPKLQPVQIAKALAREMERSQMVGAEGPLAPNHYLAYLHPSDLAGLASFQASLERELASYLAGCAGRRGLKLLSPPVVKLVAGDAHSGPGRVRVEGSMVDAPPAPAPLVEDAPQPDWEGTVEMPTAVAEPKPSVEKRTAVLVDETGQTIPLSQSETDIGRAVHNDIVLESRDVSRQHARIVGEGGKYLLLDLGSTNGCFVGGRRVTRHVLADGDTLSFGTVRFTFRLAHRQPQR